MGKVILAFLLLSDIKSRVRLSLNTNKGIILPTENQELGFLLNRGKIARTLRQSFKQVRDALADRVYQPSLSLDELQRKLSPVFVVGANRSGTSLVTSLLGQHPELEGIVASSEPGRNEAGHWQGHSESQHLWPSLFPEDEKRTRNREWPLWALPEYVERIYRRRATDDRERLKLAWAVERARETDARPLLKDPFNTLRVGLIRDVFPNACFVLVTRNWPEYIRAAAHKWTHDKSNTHLDPDVPRVGLHWLLANLLVRYDLECFAPDDYVAIRLVDLVHSPESAQEAFQEVTDRLALTYFNFDFGNVAFRRDEEPTAPDDPHFGFIRKLLSTESRILRELAQSRQEEEE